MQIKEHVHFFIISFHTYVSLYIFSIKKIQRDIKNQTLDQENDTQSLHWLMNNKKYITKILTRSSRLSIVPTKHRLVILND